MPTAHLLGQLLPFRSAALGRLVLNTKKPNEDFIDPEESPEVEKKSTQTPQDDFKETRRFSKSSNLKSYLSDIISFSYEKKNDCIATLSAPRATTYDLENSGTWFKSICGQPKIREFLSQAHEDGRKVYLVVGFRTVSDGSLVKGLNSTTAKGARFQAPLSAVLSVRTPAAAIVDPGIRSMRDVGNSQELSYTAPGEQIFAVLYRKVKFKWLSWKTDGNMVLEATNRWKSVWDWRGPEDDGPYMVEVTLTDLDEDDDLDSSDEEDDGDDENIYLRKAPPEMEKHFRSLEGVPKAGDRFEEGDNETIIPQETLSAIGVTEGTNQVVQSAEASVKQKQYRDAGGKISKWLRIELWFSLIVFAILCGGLSIFLRGP